MKSVRPSPHALAVAAALVSCGALACFAAPGHAAGADPLDSLRAAPVLDLPLLERAVLARNASLGALRAAQRESAARADQASFLMDPMVDGMAAPRSFGSDVVDPAWSLSLSQRIPLFGQRGLARRAGRAEARALGEDVRDLRLDLVSEARRLFYQAYELGRGQAVNEELRGLVEQFRRVAIQKYAAGAAGQSDALQAEVELAMLDHERVVLGRDRRVVGARLKALLHDENPAPLPEPPEALAPAATASEAVASAVATSVDALPMVRARDALRDARAEEHRLARRAGLPDLTLSARYDRFWSEVELRPVVGVGLNLPIWRGRLKARERETQAALDRADRERGAARDLARAGLDEARARVEETAHEVHVIETGVLPATERALVSARSAYESSRGDFLTLLSAERDLARARLSRHRAESTYRMALADLERARGVDPALAAAELETEGSR